KGPQLLSARQVAVKEQIRHLVEGGQLGQLGYGIAPVSESPRHRRDGSLTSDHAFQTRRIYLGGTHMMHSNLGKSRKRLQTVPLTARSPHPTMVAGKESSNSMEIVVCSHMVSVSGPAG